MYVEDTKSRHGVYVCSNGTYDVVAKDNCDDESDNKSDDASNGRKQMLNGDSIIFSADKDMIYYMFDIRDIEPSNTSNDLGYQPDNIRLEQNDREYILTINGKPFRKDKSLFTSEAMELAITETVPSISADVSKLITEFSFGNISHLLAYIIGINRREFWTSLVCDQAKRNDHIIDTAGVKKYIEAGYKPSFSEWICSDEVGGRVKRNRKLIVHMK